MAQDAARKDFSRLEAHKVRFRSVRPRCRRTRPARPGRCLPLYRARRLPPRRDRAAHDHGPRRQRQCAGQHAGHPDREATGRQRVHAASPMPCRARARLHQAIDLPKSSRRGRWSAAARIDPKAAPVGRVEFSVEDFVPEKLKVEVTSQAEILRTGQLNAFDVQADFLYGAPAADLAVEADMRDGGCAALPGLRQVPRFSGRTRSAPSLRPPPSSN